MLGIRRWKEPVETARDLAEGCSCAEERPVPGRSSGRICGKTTPPNTLRRPSTARWTSCQTLVAIRNQNDGLVAVKEMFLQTLTGRRRSVDEAPKSGSALDKESLESGLNFERR
eukprot:174766-Rhodomonas_salina.2